MAPIEKPQMRPGFKIPKLATTIQRKQEKMRNAGISESEIRDDFKRNHRSEQVHARQKIDASLQQNLRLLFVSPT